MSLPFTNIQSIWSLEINRCSERLLLSSRILTALAYLKLVITLKVTPYRNHTCTYAYESYQKHKCKILTKELRSKWVATYHVWFLMEYTTPLHNFFELGTYQKKFKERY